MCMKDIDPYHVLLAIAIPVLRMTAFALLYSKECLGHNSKWHSFSSQAIWHISMGRASATLV